MLAANALTTVDTLADELDLADVDEAAERQLQRRINIASDAIERYCNRQFARGTYTDKLAGHGGHRLILPRSPVISITSITYDGALVPASEYSLEDADCGFVYREAGWYWTGQFVTGASGAVPRPGYEQKLYEAIYVAGYILPKDGDENGTRTLPYDLEQACVETCVASWLSKGQDQRVTGESVLGASVQYSGRNPGIGREGHIIPDSALQVLNRYKRAS